MARISEIENILGAQLSYMEREYEFPPVSAPFGWAIALAQLVQDEYSDEDFKEFMDGMKDAMELFGEDEPDTRNAVDIKTSHEDIPNVMDR